MGRSPITPRARRTRSYKLLVGESEPRCATIGQGVGINFVAAEGTLHYQVIPFQPRLVRAPADNFRVPHGSVIRSREGAARAGKTMGETAGASAGGGGKGRTGSENSGKANDRGPSFSRLLSARAGSQGR